MSNPANSRPTALTSGLIAVLLVFIVGTGAIQAQTDPGQPDSVFVDSVVAFRTGIGVVPVNFYNDEALSAIEITLRHNVSQIKVDSFSFAGSRVDIAESSNTFLVDSVNRTISISSFRTGITLLGTGRGLLGHLYYSYPQSISPQVVPLDTITWQIGLIEHATTFKAGSSEPHIPQFVKGYLDIQDAPATADSLWVDQVEGEPGEPVAVDVFAYNERELSEIKLAFDFGSGALEFDSLGFDGARAAGANYTVQSSQSNHTLITSLDFSVMPLAVGTGRLLTMYYTVADTTSEQRIEIDTMTIFPATRTHYVLTPINGSLIIYPQFRKGWVDVKLPTGTEDVTPDGLLPTEFALHQNYPNPFNPTTNIEFSLPTSADVQIDVYNVLGQHVRQLVNEQLPAGVHRVEFDGLSDSGNRVASGVYFYRITAGDFVESKKMLMLK